MAISNISLTSSMRQNLLSLQKTQNLMDITQNRLSTGKKVNSALDNATNFFTAASLTNRANDLDTLMDSMGQAVQTLTAADNGITAIKSLIEQAKSNANSARDTANVASTANTSLKFSAGTTSFTPTANLAAAPGKLTIRTGTASEMTSTSSGFKAGDLASGAASTAMTITFADGKTATIAAPSATQDIKTYLEGIEMSTNGKVSARLTADGAIQIKSTDGSAINVKGGAGFGATTDITLAGTTAKAVINEINADANMQALGIHASWDIDNNTIKIENTNGSDVVFTGKGAMGLGLVSASTSLGDMTNGQNNRADYATKFNDTLVQLNQLVTNRDAGYKGINLINGDSLTVNFNESRTSSLTIKGTYLDSKGLGIGTAQNKWVSDADIDKSLAQLEKATNTLRQQASEFAQNLTTVQTRQDFTKNMIETLTTGSDKLTLADMNEEGANMLALQTRQQLGVNALSLASQAAQSVLKLF